MKSVCFLFNKAPIGNHRGRELLDICLMASAFDLPITAVFQDAGVLQLVAAQSPEMLGIKNHIATFKALELYGIEQVLVDTLSVRDYQIQTNDLIESAALTPPETIKQVIKNADFVMML
ncbi:sulfurtransferase complex subunit TusC [Kangiella sp. TOML190]|uniref:sulfurtransferase complex subunit TusC n=1 Tax=Kangiella sp. TOML190 TaxID=2931351 RepID=UPI00203C6F34|nr:sulfurtransferase complex subunit TusC [Kangiella sp. TOML190]